MSLPSLNLLRTFAVLGETLSVKRAAERLYVTPTAVSHQLRELETALGCKLFRRLPRGLALTDAGQAYWAEVAPAIRQLESATRARQAQRPFRISSFPYLAHTVVLPALGELQGLLGERLLTLDTRRETLDLASHGIDLGLRFSVDPANWGTLPARRLRRFQVSPLVAMDFPAVSWRGHGLFAAVYRASAGRALASALAGATDWRRRALGGVGGRSREPGIVACGRLAGAAAG